MVAIFTGAGTGFERGSGTVAGTAVGAAATGRGGEQVMLNAANGNLVITRQDEFLVGRGPDAAILRTYNSRGDLSDDNGDNWRMGNQRRVHDLTGTLNTAGSMVRRTTADGSLTTYGWSAAEGAYVATEGSGAYDRLRFDQVWRWTDGDTQTVETYAGPDQRISEIADSSGNRIGFSYQNGRLWRTTTADGGTIDYAWSGNNITATTVGYRDAQTGQQAASIRTRYGYDSLNRLQTVEVDLSPDDNVTGDGNTYVTTYAYHGSSRNVASIAQSDGSSTAFTYDAAGRVDRIAQAVSGTTNRVTTIAYGNGATTITDPSGQQTTFEYNADGALRTLIAPPAGNGGAQQVTRFAYTANGDVASVTDPSGRTTRHVYDPRGNAVMTLEPDGGVVVRSFNADNQLLTEARDANRVHNAAVSFSSEGWGIAYNPNGIASGPVQTGNWQGKNYVRAHYRATAAGQILSLGSSSFDVEPGERLFVGTGLEAWAPIGNQTLAVWWSDRNGNAVGSTNIASVEGHQNYDTKVAAFIDVPPGAVRGRLELYGQTGGAGDGHFLMVEPTVVRVAAGQSQSPAFGSYADGSGPSVTRYVYDDAKRLAFVIDGEGGVTSRIHDAAGQVAWTLAMTDKRYDLAGLGHNGVPTLAQITDWMNAQDRSGAMVTGYQYDAQGNLIGQVVYGTTQPNGYGSVADGYSYTTFQYDRAGQLIGRAAGRGSLQSAPDGRLGRFLQESGVRTGGQTLSKRYTLNPGSARTAIDADLIKLDSWDGERLTVYLNDAAAFSFVPETAPGGVGVDKQSGQLSVGGITGTWTITSGDSDVYVAGAPQFGDRTYRLHLDLRGAGGAITFGLGSTLDQERADESFGIDNVVVTQDATFDDFETGPAGWTLNGAPAPVQPAQRGDRGGMGAALGPVGNTGGGEALHKTYALNPAAGTTGVDFDFTRVDSWDNEKFAVFLNGVRVVDLSLYIFSGTATTTTGSFDTNGLRGSYRITPLGEEMQRAGVGEWTDQRYHVALQVDGAGGSLRLGFGAALDEAVANESFTIDSVRVGQAAMIDTFQSDAATGWGASSGTATVAGWGTGDPALLPGRESFVYDGLGRLIASTDAGGATTRIVFDDRGSRTITAIASGLTTISTYDRAGGLIATSRSGGFVTNGSESFVYDAMGRPRMRTDASGNASYWLYDTAGRKVADIGHGGQMAGYRYNASGQLTATIQHAIAVEGRHLVTLASGATIDVATLRPAVHAQDLVTWNVYDGTGRLTGRVDGSGAVVEYGYTANQQIAWVRSYRTRLDTGTVDGFRTTPPAGLIRPMVSDGDTLTRNFHDRTGRLIGALDGEGYLTRIEYDAAGRKTRELRPANAVAAGLRTNGSYADVATSAGTAALDRDQRYIYDNQGLLRYVLNGGGRTTEYRHDSGEGVTAPGGPVQTIDYAGSVGALADYRFATVRDAVAGLGSLAGNRSSFVVSDRAGRVAYTIDAEGTVVGHGYDAIGQRVRTTTFARRRATTTLPSRLDMAQWATANADGTDRTVRVVRDAAGQERFAIDGEGYVTGTDHDADGRVLRTLRWDARIAIDDAATVASVGALLGGPATAVHYTYDALGRTVEVVDGEGSRTRRVYGVHGLLQQEIAAYATAAQVTTAYAYDGAGRVRSRTVAAGTADAATVQFEYDHLGNAVAETDPLGRVTRHEYDRAGRRTATVDALNGRTRYEYDAFDNVVRTTDARGNATLRHYDKLDRVIAVRDAEDHVTETTYTTFGEIASVTRRANRASNAASTAILPSVTGDARDATTRFQYDRLGRVIASIDAENFVEQRWYDAFGNVVQTQNKVGGIARKVYDRRGLLVGETTVHGSNAPEGPLRARDASATEFDVVFYRASNPDIAAYDDAGLRRHWEDHGWRERRNPNAFFDTRFYIDTYYDVAGSGMDPLFHYARYGVNEGRRPAMHASAMPLQATGGTVSWLEYDARGNLKRRIDAAGLPEQRSTGYVYDKADRLVETRGDVVGWTDAASYQVQGAAAPVDRLVYDLRGNVIERVDARGARTLSWYDALDRRIAEAGPTGTLSTWTYDKAGNIVSAKVHDTPIILPGDARGAPPVSASGVRETRFGYDRLNRVEWQDIVAVRWGAGQPGSYDTATGNRRTSFVYDAGGNVLASTDGSGITVHSVYDRAGRRIRQADGDRYVTEWQYDAEANVTQERRFANVAARVAVGVIDPGATSGDDRVTSFTYDRNGRRTAETRHGVVAYDLDAHGQLFERAERDQSVGYAYTALGQVYAKTEATGEVTRYDHDFAGRLRNETRAAHVDAGGNIVTPSVDYFYDALGNLVRTEQNGGGGTVARATTYRYGAGARLESMTDAAGATTHYFYNLAGDLLRQSYARTVVGSAGDTVRAEATLYTRDPLGRVTSEAKGAWNGTAWVRGDVLRSRYNAHGQIAERGIGSATVERYYEKFRYDAAGQLIASNAGDGVWRYHVYDGAGRQTLTIANLTRTELVDGDHDAVLAIARGGGARIGQQTVSGVYLTFQTFDARGLVIGVAEPFAQTADATMSGRSRAIGRTAFGEVSYETDFAGNRTEYGYNTMGRVVTVRRPQVDAYAEDGGVAAVRPQETNFHDRSGRLIGSDDALHRRQTRALLAGTGYAGTEALTTTAWDATRNTTRLVYDGFGDVRKSVDELNNETGMTYDAMGRVLTIHRPGNMREYYGYDELGQRVRHWNVGYGEDQAALTRYDAQGRIAWTRAIGGADADTVSTDRVWSGWQGVSGDAAFGGWDETSTYVNGKSTLTRTDVFERTIEASDMGGRVSTYFYDLGGRLSEEQLRVTRYGTVVRNTAYDVLNTGLVRQVLRRDAVNGMLSDAMETQAGYNLNGRKTSEKSWRWEQGSRIQTQDATSTYDALGRRTRWAEAGNGNVTPAASIEHRYDAVGNIHYTTSTAPALGSDGNLSWQRTGEEWFRYDARNRVVRSEYRNNTGGLPESTVVTTLYDAAGRRTRTQRTVMFEAQVQSDRDDHEYYGSNRTYWMTVLYEGLQREDYTYTAAGTLHEVRIATSGYRDNYDGTATALDLSATGRLSARYSYDELGRMRRQLEWSGDGTGVVHDRQTHYDAVGRLGWETSVTRQGSETRRTNSYYGYTRGTDYALGTALTVTVNTLRISAAGASVSGTEITEEGQFEHQSVTQTHVEWYGGAVTQRTETKQARVADRSSSYAYDAGGTLQSVSIVDARPRTVSYRSDLAGQVVERREADHVAGTGDPRELTYRFDGQQQVQAGNDGSDPSDYRTSLEQRGAAAQTGPFRTGNYGMSHVQAGQAPDAITSYSQGSASGQYVARGGETLGEVARALWGDASLWYRLGQANGLGAGAALFEGQRLTVPPNVLRAANGAGTFEPYDPAAAIGDTSPTSPVPRGRRNKCGGLGAVLVAAMAVVAAVYLAPALIGSVSAGGASGLIGLFGGTAATAGAGSGIAIGAGIAGGALAGAAGSIAGQGLALATGLQDRFSWSGVALAAIGGGIGGGIGGAGILNATGGTAALAQGAVRGALGNVLMQGTALASGLQRRFDWAGLAVAGVAGGVGQLAGGAGRGAGRQFAGGAASAIAGAATRALATGTSFGDNVLAVLPDVVGATVGRIVGDAVARAAVGTGLSSPTTSSGMLLISEYVAPDIDLAAGGVAAILAGVKRQAYREQLVAEQVAIDIAAERTALSPSSMQYEGEFVVVGRSTDPRPAVQTWEGRFGSTRSVERERAKYQTEFDSRPGYYNRRAYDRTMRGYAQWHEYLAGIEMRVDARIDSEIAGIALAGPVGGGLLALGALALPGIVSAGRGFVYANALRISTAGQLGTDLLTGTQVGTYLPASAGVATASLVAVERSIVGGPANRAAFEVYKDGLRAGMEKPFTSDPKLSSILKELYRPNATVGSGSTAAAVRQELATGANVGGKMHSQKAADSIRALEKWLERNPTARSGDRAAAENVIRDTRNALGW